MARLKDLCKKKIVPELAKELDLKNNLAVPRLEKIVINVGAGRATADPKIVDRVAEDISLITGQKPVITRAKKSIASFSLREKMPIGAKVTLRKEKMYEFLDRLLNITLPRVRDFRGTKPDAFDGNGNYSLGIKEHTVFPEIDHDNVENVYGLEISFITTAKDDESAKKLLSALGMPFAKEADDLKGEENG